MQTFGGEIELVAPVCISISDTLIQ